MLDEDREVVSLNLISIDQSFTGTGIAAWYDGELHITVFKTEKKMKNLKSPSIDKTRRIRRICKRIDMMCKGVKFDYAIIEGLSYGSKGSALLDLGGLSHAIRNVFIDHEIPFVVIPPTVAKMFWVGKGNASKQDLIEETKKRGITIPYNYDDNCNDAYIFFEFLVKLLNGDLSEEMAEKVERSWVP